MNYFELFDPEEITVEKMWGVIASALFRGQHVHEVQYMEMQRAFYMGLTEGLKLVSDASESLLEDGAVKFLTRIQGEVNAFHTKEIERLKGGES